MQKPLDAVCAVWYHKFNHLIEGANDAHGARVDDYGERNMARNRMFPKEKPLAAIICAGADP